MKAAKEIRNLSPVALAEKLGEFKKELLKLRVQSATGSISNPGSLKQAKKNIARLLTAAKKLERDAK